ncbi:MAG TPA: carbohydrate ABC transporter permease [Lachnoclostridium sp.]|uniref:Putative aldouronate transport system permease protein n=1 Tax=[Clostridium] celerecrescens 18A TaxID=1286362 RepID=A0A2M8Z855_9FIRM|nr:MULTISPECIES: carbohydrate ABC transporter permease [Lacrimispora]PJJ29621.1 putative aldouronate transport system permease protein [[Clostridium] celerecrescens 18A]HBE87407.1 carbohydrate ABC transporter permease [Lachnoclostridium sp.]
MKVKISRGERIFHVVNYIILTIVALICLYPMWFVAMASFSDSSQLIAHSGFLLKPLGFNLQAYLKVFENPMILKGYANTLFILVVGVALDLVMTALAAYFFSRKGVMFKKPLMLFVLFTMFFSGGMIPFYLNLKDLHLINSRWGLIIPFMISTYNMIILRTSFESIPDSLTEAARIDGAGHITILFKIILPLSKAIMAVMVLYYGVSIWNAWFWASAILRDRELYPLQVILREILISNDLQAMNGGAGADAEAIAQSIKYATIMVATVPILFVYPFLQKYFTKGVMIGAVKE